MRSTSVSRCSPVCSQKSEKRPKVTHSLGRRAKDEHATVEDRFTAALDLASLAPDPQQVAEVTAMLLAWLERDEHLRLKIAAVNSLGDLGKGDKRVVPALIKALDHPSRPVHVGAAAALSKLGTDPDVAVAAMVTFLKKHKGDPEFVVSRGSVMLFLGDLGPHAAQAVPLILETVAHEREPRAVRTDAIRGLGSIGPAAKEAVAVLRKIMKKEKENMKDLFRPA